MLIVSNFHDYYDGALGQSGVDKTIVYRRMTHEQKMIQKGGKETEYNTLTKKLPVIGNIPVPDGHWHERISGENPDRRIETGVVIFCGKVYPFIYVAIKDRRLACDDKVTYIFSDYEEQIRSFFEENDRGLPYRFKQRIAYYVDVYLPQIVERDYSELNKTFESPILLAWDEGRHYNGSLVIDPCLKDIQFYKAVDTFTAFQELQHFIGNVLTNNEDPEPQDLTEPQKLTTKGMDGTSFKRTEHPRKAKRKREREQSND